MNGFAHTFSRRRLTLALVFGTALGLQISNLGCATGRPVPPSRCQTQMTDLVTQQTTPFTWGEAPFSLGPRDVEARVCGEPPTPEAVEGVWNNFLLARLSQICNPTHPQYPLFRDRFCPIARWCAMPTSTTCARNSAVLSECTLPTEPMIVLPTCPEPPTGTDPRLCADSLTVNFPPTAVGATATASLTVRHCGGGQLLVRHPVDWILNAPMASRASFAGSGLAASWDCDPLMADEAFVGGARLGPGGRTAPSACTVTLRFRPETAGEKTATLFVTSNDPRQPMLPVSLRGTGTNVAAGLTILGTRPACAATTRVCFDNAHTTASPAGSCPAGTGPGRERTITVTATGGPVALRRLRPALSMPGGEWQDVSGLTYPQAITEAGTRTLRIRRCARTPPVDVNLMVNLETDDTCATYPLLLDTTTGCTGP